MVTPVGEHAFQLNSPAGPLDACLLQPALAVAQLVFAHGAGAGFQHATMSALAHAFADEGLATLRFNFPFMQQGKRRVDKPSVCTQAIVSAAAELQQRDSIPLFLGGHSFGGRMCSHAVVDHQMACAGLIFCSFPLHVAKKPGVERAAHLPQIHQPMLFLSGTRDDLAEPSLLKEVVANLPTARMHWLDTANHSYTVLKRTRTHHLSVFEEIARTARLFVDEVI